jgi:outer membrane protein assembly factor BamB
VLQSSFRLWKRGRTAAVLVLLVLVLAGCATGPLDPVWGSLSMYPDNQSILFAFDSHITQLNPIDGSRLPLRDAEGNVRLDDSGNPRTWDVMTTGTPAKFFSAPMLIAEDTLLAVSYDRGIYELDVETARFSTAEGQPLNAQVVGEPLLAGDRLYVPFNGRNVTAYDAVTYTPLWTLETEQSVYAQPLLVENTLYIASLDHNLYALDAETGETLWTVDMGGAVTSQPLYVDGFLYFGSFSRAFYKVDAGDGSIVAEYGTRDWVWGTPLLHEGVFYFGDVSGFIYALTDEGESFSPIFEPSQVATRAIVASPVVTSSGQIVVGSRDRKVVWVNPETGAAEITREMAGEVLGNILVIAEGEADNSRELVVVSTLARNELVVAFAANNGERLWSFAR